MRSFEMTVLWKFEHFTKFSVFKNQFLGFKNVKISTLLIYFECSIWKLKCNLNNLIQILFFSIL